MVNSAAAAAKRLLIVDRDGVINYDSPDYIKTPDEWVPLPGSLNAIARLCDAGIRIAVVTNQAGVGRGLFTAETLHAIHAKMLSLVARSGGGIERIYYCPHPPEARCDCRKPRPGMLRQIEADLGLSVAGVPVVGDSLKDLLAAEAVQAQPVLVLTGSGKKTLAEGGLPRGTLVYADLAAFVETLLTQPC